MAVLFQRKARLILDTLLIEDLRVVFKIKKTLKKEPNTAEVSVYNLNADHRAAFQKHQRVPLIIEAGYETTIAQLFAGDTRYVDQKREGPNWVTSVQCGDGERAYQYRRINQSFRPGTKVADVVKVLVKALGLTVTGLDKVKALSEQFVHGFSPFGKAATELDHLLRSRGLEWSIQDGQLQIVAIGQATSDSIVTLSADSGLIGSPEHGDPEKKVPVAQLDPEAEGFTTGATSKKGPAVLKVKSLLQPALKPGRPVRVSAAGIDGTFRIETVEHKGDTHGTDWYSEIQCIPIR